MRPAGAWTIQTPSFRFGDPRNEDASSNDFDFIHAITPSTANRGHAQDGKRVSNSSVSMYSATIGVAMFSQGSRHPPRLLQGLPPIAPDPTLSTDETSQRLRRIHPSIEDEPTRSGRSHVLTLTMLPSRLKPRDSAPSTPSSLTFPKSLSHLLFKNPWGSLAARYDHIYNGMPLCGDSGASSHVHCADGC